MSKDAVPATRPAPKLELACRTADDADRLTEALAQSSSVLVEGSKGQPVVNPLEREVRDTRNALARLLAALALPTDGGWDNLTASQRARKAARARV